MAKNTTTKKLLIIDGNALIHRSFHALPETMVNSQGQAVNAVYGFTTALLKAVKEFKPAYIALTLDKKEPTFRHEKFKAYKATRVKAPDSLYAQIPLVKEVAKAFGIPIYELSGWEADDLIGTITHEVDGKIEKIILTGDMDSLQLVNDHTKVYNFSRGVSDAILYDAALVEARYGLTPAQIVDYKALRGDTSDNIPGVPGIGEKTATILLQQFGTLEKLYQHLDEAQVSDRVKELLKDNHDSAIMSQDLATIRLDAPIDFKLDEAKFGEFDADKVFAVLTDLEFKSLLGRVKELLPPSTSSGPAEKNSALDKFERNREQFNYILVDDEAKFKKFFAKLEKQKFFALDSETGGLDNFNDQLLGLSFSWHEGEAYFISIRQEHDNTKAKKNLFDYQTGDKKHELHPWLKKLQPLLADPKVKKYGHNIKFDYKVLATFGLKVNGIEFDTMIASYLLDPDSRAHSLDALAYGELGFNKISKEDLLGAGVKKISYDQVGLDKLGSYAAEDADFTRRLVEPLHKKLQAQKLKKLFEEIEMPLLPVLADMELCGIKIDEKFLAKLDKKIDKQLEQLSSKIWALAGANFNINSTQQLREILFTKLKIASEGISKNKTGFSTGAEELAKLKGKHEIIDLLMEYRELQKLSTTYVKALPRLVNPATGRLHTTYNQTMAATGRLSSTNPNLQNIPARTELGREVRHAFIADDGWSLLSLDYSQIELRLAAAMSDDQKMLRAFALGQDIHTATAAEINGVELKDVTPEMRQAAKAINFGILYGQGAHGLAQTADISFLQARDFIAKYFTVYDGVRKYLDQTLIEARDQGYVQTLLGRRRYLPDLQSANMMLKKSAERMAINTPIQGTAADMIKLAMIEVDQLIKTEHSDVARLLLQVHDELILEVRDDKINIIAREVRAIMEKVLKLKVEIIVAAKAGKNWEDMKKI